MQSKLQKFLNTIMPELTMQIERRDSEIKSY